MNSWSLIYNVLFGFYFEKDLSKVEQFCKELIKNESFVKEIINNILEKDFFVNLSCISKQQSAKITSSKADGRNLNEQN